MGAPDLAIVKEQKGRPKRKRERIELIEKPPDPKWFATAKDCHGRTIWFLRFQVTGMLMRRYGPFPTKHKALLFLDRLLDEVGDSLCEAVTAHLGTYQIRGRQFSYRGCHYPVVEDELVTKSTRAVSDKEIKKGGL